MKKIIFLFLLVNYNISAQNENIYGLWGNTEGEYVDITNDDMFVRYKVGQYNNKEILSQGYIEYYGKEMHIIRTDTVDNYNLGYFVGSENLVIAKPYSNRAWVWEKIYDY
jgi:hypothetical protein